MKRNAIVRTKFLILFFVLTVTIVFFGLSFIKNQREQVIRNKKEYLKSISLYKSEQISDWRTEKFNTAMILTSTSSFGDVINSYFQNPQDEKIKNNVSDVINKFKKLNNYNSISLVGSDGKIKFGLPHDYSMIHSVDSLNNKIVRKSKKILFSDFHKNILSDKVEAHIHIPIFKSDSEDTTIVGIMMCTLEPYQFIYPLIQKWPTPTETGESFFVRKERDKLLYLSELKFRKNSALNFTLPDSIKDLPAAMAASGKAGFVQGLDYRGIEVLAYVTHINNSPWYMVSKIDLDEVTEKIDRGLFILAFIIILFLITGASITGYFWKKHNVSFYQKLFESEREKNALKKRFVALFNQANDAILLLDYDYNIVEANDRASQMYGYKKEEMIGKKVEDLLIVSNLKDELFGIRQRIKNQNGLVNEVQHKKNRENHFQLKLVQAK